MADPRGYYLSPESYADFERMRALFEPGTSGGGGPGAGGSRYVTFATVTGGYTNPYTANVVYWDGQFSQVVHAEGVRLYNVRSADLEIDQTYFAIRTGWSGGMPVFLTAGDTVGFGCNLKYDEHGNIAVDVGSLAGDGLEVYYDCPSDSSTSSSESSSDSGTSESSSDTGSDSSSDEGTGGFEDSSGIDGSSASSDSDSSTSTGSDSSGSSTPPRPCCPKLRISLPPVCFRYLDDITDVTATCNEDGTISIELTKVYKYFSGYGTVSDDPCDSSDSSDPSDSSDSASSDPFSDSSSDAGG